MPDPRDMLQALFRVDHRFANFGGVLMSLNVRGFRCHDDTSIEIESPITAFCGLNGTGKSTLLQLSAAAYRSDNDSARYYIKDFVVSGTLDLTPFRADSAVEYGYWQDSRTTRTVVVTRSDPEKRWLHYRNQPIRRVYFAGMGIYLPRVEVNDFIVRHANRIRIEETEQLPQTSREWASQILSTNYDDMVKNTVTHDNKTGYLVSVSRSGNTYSEANMGCGEGRVQHLISVLETLPQHSLIVMEEPETSLHPSAQRAFGRYLVDVSTRKRHQIILSTHSEYLLAALPTASRIYLDRSPEGLRPIPGITTAQAISFMTGGVDKALHILVEDNVAEAILTEILRRADPTFLRTIKIHQAGDSQGIQAAMKALQASNLPVAAVRDGDKGASPAQNMYKLPGILPPEKELFSCQAVHEVVLAEYNISLTDFAVMLTSIDHHQWFKRLADHAVTPETALIQQAAKAYAMSLPDTHVDELVRPLQAAVK